MRSGPVVGAYPNANVRVVGELAGTSAGLVPVAWDGAVTTNEHAPLVVLPEVPVERALAPLAVHRPAFERARHLELNGLVTVAEAELVGEEAVLRDALALGALDRRDRELPTPTELASAGA